MKAVRGNWHNAIYISCKHCTSCIRQSQCEGFLMTADADGQPVIISVNMIRSLSGENPQLEDCLDIMEMRVFKTLYSLYLEWHIISTDECPLMQICQTDCHSLS